MSYNPYEIRLNGKLRKLGGGGAQGMARSEGMRVASRKVGVAKVLGCGKILGHGKTLVGRGGGEQNFFKDMEECVA